MQWSYSSISLFKQCPRKYHHLRILKDVVDPVTSYLMYDSDAHKAAEDYGRDGVPLPARFEFMKSMIDAIMCSSGERLFEQKLAVTRDLVACDFDSHYAWWRGIADFMAVPAAGDGDEATLVDYKTGKSAKFADTDQLELLSLAIFAQYPHIKKVKGGLLFVVSKEFITLHVDREGSEARWDKWKNFSQRLDDCNMYNVWNPSTNFTCRNFCAVTTCEHNGRN
jgi:hypothetical protein